MLSRYTHGRCHGQASRELGQSVDDQTPPPHSPALKMGSSQEHTEQAVMTIRTPLKHLKHILYFNSLAF